MPDAGDHIKTILLVEDNEDDVALLREAFREIGIAEDLQVVQDGVDAMAFLRQQQSFDTAPRPDLILLDLNLPRKSGFEVLDDVKADPSLKSIPIVILSSSDAKDDIARSYAHNANCYIAKPVGLNALYDTVRLIHDFWLNLARLPTGPQQ